MIPISKGEQLDMFAELIGTKRALFESDEQLRIRLVALVRGEEKLDEEI